VTNAPERRCKAKSRSGERCRAHVVNAAGYCVAHDPEKPVDYRALGRKSAEARKRPNRDRVHPNLREYLRENVEPAEVWAALKLAMEGQNESARVAASRVLMDALHEPEQQNERQHQADAEAARAKLDEVIESYVAAALGTERRLYDPKNDSPVMATVRAAVRKAREGQDDELVALIGRSSLTSRTASCSPTCPPLRTSSACTASSRRSA
jgi:hypothetical protein